MEWKFTKHTGPAQHGWRCSVAGVHYVVISGLDDGASILSTHGSVYLGPLHFASAQDARIYAEANARAVVANAAEPLPENRPRSRTKDEIVEKNNVISIA